MASQRRPRRTRAAGCPTWSLLRTAAERDPRGTPRRGAGGRRLIFGFTAAKREVRQRSQRPSSGAVEGGADGQSRFLWRDPASPDGPCLSPARRCEQVVPASVACQRGLVRDIRTAGRRARRGRLPRGACLAAGWFSGRQSRDRSLGCDRPVALRGHLIHSDARLSLCWEKSVSEVPQFGGMAC